MNVGVTGGRDYDDEQHVYDVLDDVLANYGVVTLHVGDAYGVDALTREWAFDRRVPVQVYRADWARHGKGAGPIRNRLIVDNSDVVYAFPGGRGTEDCVRAAQRAGLTVWRVA